MSFLAVQIYSDPIEAHDPQKVISEASGWFYFLILGIVYLFPTFLASSRKHKNTTAIFLTNLLFGWTVLGWFVCLIWATTSNVSQTSRLKKAIDN